MYRLFSSAVMCVETRVSPVELGSVSPGAGTPRPAVRRSVPFSVRWRGFRARPSGRVGAAAAPGRARRQPRAQRRLPSSTGSSSGLSAAL